MLDDFIASAPSDDFWIWSGILALLALALAWGAARQFHRARVIENTPTSKLRSAAQGYVELEGRARAVPGQPLHGPLSGRPCVWYEYEIEKYQGGKHSRWRTVERGESDHPFLLDDGTGTCLVIPAGASITPSVQAAWSGNRRHPDPGDAPRDSSAGLLTAWLSSGRYRYTEKRILDGDPLYCLGEFRTLTDATRERRIASAVRDALQALKKNPEILHRHFDKNGDGELDSREWERARQATVGHVTARFGARGRDGGIDTLVRPGLRRQPFVISTTPQPALTRRLKLTAAFCLAGFLATGPLAAYLVLQRLAGP